MIVTRGDIVLVRYPFTSGIGAKVRPAVIVQCDKNNQRMSSTIVASVTSNLQNAAEATQVVIDISSADGKLSGLHTSSVIKCESLLSIEHSLIQRRIGFLSPLLLSRLNDALRAALELP